MSYRLMLEEQERSTSAPALSAADTVAAAEANAESATEVSTLPSDESDHTAVFPSPLATAAAIGVGSTIGFATVYGLAALQVNPASGVAVIVVLFALSMLGIRHLPDAKTESSRAVAVALNALALGATLGGLVVLT